ncbi:MAG: D-alanine--D-alanine ligase family protein [Myxococcota bacterium]
MLLDHLDRERFRGQTVGVITGGASAERDISLQTGKGFAEALEALEYDVRVYDVPADLDALHQDRPAAVILGLHGHAGENGVLQGHLEMLRIPYTGSGVLASALAMDKQRTKAVLSSAGVRCPRGTLLEVDDESYDAAQVRAILDQAELRLPVIVKPNDDGSSVGITLCDDDETVARALMEAAEVGSQQASSGVLIEEYLDGPEFTVGFFDHVCLGAIQVIPGEAFYDFKAKYESNDTRYEAVEDTDLNSALESIGRDAYNAVGCRGVARVDLKSRRTENGLELSVLELNTIPGMTATSLVPKLAARHGIAFEAFTELMLASAGCEMQWH